MINNDGDCVARYVVTLEKLTGKIIEYTTTAKCDYMAVEKAERWIKNISTAKYTPIAVEKIS